jgi:hypothetical protein
VDNIKESTSIFIWKENKKTQVFSFPVELDLTLTKTNLLRYEFKLYCISKLIPIADLYISLNTRRLIKYLLKHRYESIETIETISDASDDDSKNSEYTKKVLSVCDYELSMLTSLDCHGELGEINHNKIKDFKQKEKINETQEQVKLINHNKPQPLEFKNKRFGFTIDTIEKVNEQFIIDCEKRKKKEKNKEKRNKRKERKKISKLYDEKSKYDLKYPVNFVKNDESHIKINTTEVVTISSKNSDQCFEEEFTKFKDSHGELDEEQIHSIRTLLLCNFLQFDSFTIHHDRVILLKPIGRAYGDFIKDRNRKYISTCDGVQHGISRIYIEDLYKKC